MTTNIFMDIKFNSYDKDAEIVSLSLLDNTQYERILYMENSDYDVLNNTGWLPGDNAVNNRLLTDDTPQFDSNINSKYVSNLDFPLHINTYLQNYSRVRIYTNNPLAWTLFVDLFGTIEDLPSKIEQIPVFLPSILLSKGIAPDTDINKMINNDLYKVLRDNALYDVIKYKEIYNDLLIISRS